MFIIHKLGVILDFWGVNGSKQQIYHAPRYCFSCSGVLARPVMKNSSTTGFLLSLLSFVFFGAIAHSDVPRPTPPPTINLRLVVQGTLTGDLTPQACPPMPGFPCPNEFSANPSLEKLVGNQPVGIRTVVLNFLDKKSQGSNRSLNQLEFRGFTLELGKPVCLVAQISVRRGASQIIIDNDQEVESLSPCSVDDSLSPLAEYNFHSGYSRNPVQLKVTIHENGLVTFRKKSLSTGGGNWIESGGQLAEFSKDVLVKIKTLRTSIQLSDLIDPNPGAPRCADAPATTFSVYQNGSPVVIQKKAECHFQNNSTAEAAQLIQLLHSFVGLVP